MGALFEICTRATTLYSCYMKINSFSANQKRVILHVHFQWGFGPRGNAIVIFAPHLIASRIDRNHVNASVLDLENNSRDLSLQVICQKTEIILRPKQFLTIKNTTNSPFKSDKHLNSPYKIPLESNIKVTRIREMITNHSQALDC